MTQETLKIDTKITADYLLTAPFGLPAVSSSTTLGFNAWARRENPKKEIFDRYIEAADHIGRRLVAYIDNRCTLLQTGRTIEEQSLVDENYREYFLERGQDIHFSSDLLVSEPTLSEYITASRRIKTGSFVQNILPEHKRSNVDQLPLAEFGHAFSQLLFLESIAEREDLIICGKQSQGIMFCAREAIPEFPKIIVLDIKSQN